MFEFVRGFFSWSFKKFLQGKNVFGFVFWVERSLKNLHTENSDLAVYTQPVQLRAARGWALLSEESDGNSKYYLIF